MNSGDDGAQCVYCHTFKAREEMEVIFQTGFIQKVGVSYPLGICKDCDKNVRLKRTGTERES